MGFRQTALGSRSLPFAIFVDEDRPRRPKRLDDIGARLDQVANRLAGPMNALPNGIDEKVIYIAAIASGSIFGLGPQSIDHLDHFTKGQAGEVQLIYILGGFKFAVKADHQATASVVGATPIQCSSDLLEHPCRINQLQVMRFDRP